IGPADNSGIQQINVILPQLEERTGLLPVEVLWFGNSCLEKPATLRVIPAGPRVPRVTGVSDGVNLLSGVKIQSRTVKITFEEVSHPDEFRVTFDAEPVLDVETFCTNPLSQRFEVNFRLPEAVATGQHELQVYLGKRRFGPISVEVV
ncbi:MAG: hypothetical protein ACRD9L_17095, partial [Bryobacteraceae bacterium]